MHTTFSNSIDELHIKMYNLHVYEYITRMANGMENWIGRQNIKRNTTHLKQYKLTIASDHFDDFVSLFHLDLKFIAMAIKYIFTI